MSARARHSGGAAAAGKAQTGQAQQGLELSAEDGVGSVTLSGAYTMLRARCDSGSASIPAGHTLLGIGARFEQTTGAWTWREFVRIDNLTDKKHAGSVIVNDGNGRFFEPGPGRKLLLGLEAQRKF